jgi:hypothetical protein
VAPAILACTSVQLAVWPTTLSQTQTTKVPLCTRTLCTHAAQLLLLLLLRQHMATSGERDANTRAWHVHVPGAPAAAAAAAAPGAGPAGREGAPGGGGRPGLGPAGSGGGLGSGTLLSPACSCLPSSSACRFLNSSSCKHSTRYDQKFLRAGSHTIVKKRCDAKSATWRHLKRGCSSNLDELRIQRGRYNRMLAA